MSKTAGLSKQSKIVIEAIKHAQATARDDDRAFLSTLRQRAWAQMPPEPPAPRTGGGARSLALRPSGNRGFKGAKLDADPRYLANVRALAKKTARNARIIGGTKIIGSTFDDCVAVGDDSEFGCTGTLIAPDLVLTAGHCEALHTRIFVGNDINKRGRIFRVQEHVRHPDWDEDLNNDVMLLLLERPVTGVTPRKLATTAAIDKATDGRVVGFGTTNLAGTKGFGVKQQTDVPIVSVACQGRVSGRPDSTVYGCHKGKEFVAGKPLLLHDTCRGDSGGPLYVSDGRGNWALAGVTSRGTDLAKTMCGDGGVYTRVDKYQAWMASVSRAKPVKKTGTVRAAKAASKRGKPAAARKRSSAALERG